MKKFFQLILPKHCVVFISMVQKGVKLNKPFLPLIAHTHFYFSEQYRPNTDLLDRELPWFNYSIYKQVKKLLSKDMKVFEYGAGGSTLFFRKFVESVVSIEHDDEWFKILSLKIAEKKINNVNLKLVNPSQINSSLEGCFFSSSAKKWMGYDFNEYVNSIQNYPDYYFDLVVIDGRARPYCLRKALSKIKVGGYLIFDNADRDHYQEDLLNIKNNLLYKSYGPTIGNYSFSETHIYQF